MSSLQQSDLDRLRHELQCLLADHGYSEEPDAGCTPSNVDSDQISQIVQGVMGELARRGIA